MSAGSANESEVRVEFMPKRSQNKSAMTRTNYKTRWFALTQNQLIYYDGSDDKRGKEKNRINLEHIRVVEAVADRAFHESSKHHGIQIMYNEPGSENPITLYFFPSSKEAQQDWLRDLQHLCRQNPQLSDRYHYGIWTMSKWTCCQKEYKGAPGCQNTFIQSQQQSQQSLQQYDQQPHLPVHKVPSGSNIQLQLQPQPPSTTDANGWNQAPKPNKIKNPSQPHPSRSRPKPPVPTPERPKLYVIAKYEYAPIESTDIPLKRGLEYAVLDNSREYWWKVRDEHGREGYIPSNYVEEKSKYSTGLERYEWFNGKWSRQRTELELRNESKEGCFIVRTSSTPGLYTLSVLAKEKGPSGEDVVRHYHIKQNHNKDYYVAEKHCFRDMAKLIEYHQHNAGGLITRLRNPPGFTLPTTAGLGSGMWDIKWSELTIIHELGRGQFGVVSLAKLNKTNQLVAVKRMQEGAMSEEDFVDEARVMQELQHENLVQLYGITTTHRPLCIITEYMPKGCLLNYLRQKKNTILEQTSILIYMTQQVCSGMAYLENKRFIHRDLAARNCLVGDKHIVKVADFGLTRYVMDDEYTSTGTKFPIKWAPPEVLHFTRFSSKSDVWAFGILIWEIFSGGLAPYPGMSNVEVVDQVTRKNYRMDRPQHCPYNIHRVMKECWKERADERPSFATLLRKLDQASDKEFS